MIEKIIAPTLDRIPGRRYVNLGALVTIGVPHGLIEYFLGTIVLHYMDKRS